MRPKVLVVEDDPTTQRLLTAILEGEGADVDTAGDGEVAIELLSKRNYALILLDIVLPRISGTAVMEHLRMTKPSVLENIVVVTGLDVSEIRELFPTVKSALSKPVMPGRLRAAARSCVPSWESAGPSVA